MQQLNLYRTQIGNGELKLILVANKGKSFSKSLILASTNTVVQVLLFNAKLMSATQFMAKLLAKSDFRQ